MTKRLKLIQTMIEHRKREIVTSPNLGAHKMEKWLTSIAALMEKAAMKPKVNRVWCNSDEDL